MNKYLDLFFTFARIGGLTFGGGYAMLPMLQKEVVEKRGWATEEELMDYYALGQCTPGIIAVNTATFVGQNTAETISAFYIYNGNVQLVAILGLYIHILFGYNVLLNYNALLFRYRNVKSILILNCYPSFARKSNYDSASGLVKKSNFIAYSHLY